MLNLLLSGDTTSGSVEIGPMFCTAHVNNCSCSTLGK